jgi:hypothetical protein
METIDVIEFTVPGLAYDRKAEVSRTGKLFIAPLNHGIAHDTHAVRIGQQHRPFQKARFFDPFTTRHFSVAVKRKNRRGHRRINVALPQRKNCGDSGPDWPLANHKFSVAFHQRCLANLNTAHIGDRVHLAWRALEWNSQVAGPCQPGCDVSRGGKGVKAT